MTENKTGSLNYNALQNIIMNNDIFLASLKCILCTNFIYVPPYFLHCLRRTHQSLFCGLFRRYSRKPPCLMNIKVCTYLLYMLPPLRLIWLIASLCVTANLHQIVYMPCLFNNKIDELKKQTVIVVLVDRICFIYHRVAATI